MTDPSARRPEWQTRSMGIPPRRFTGLAKQIRQAQFFTGIADTDITQMLEFSRLRLLRGGEVVFQQYEPCSAFFLLTSGSVKLYRSTLGGQEKAVEFICAGKTFGEVGMFSGDGYPLNAMAVEDGEVIAFDCFRFNRYMQTRPAITWKMLHNLSEQLTRMFDQVETLATHSAEQKVAAYLIRQWDREDVGGWVSGMPTKRNDLANMLGIQAETLCRTLARFRKQGWIEAEGLQLRIVDFSGLQAVMEKDGRQRGQLPDA